MNTYVDSSVVLRLTFGEARPLLEWANIERFVASALLVVECFRAVDRLRFHGRYSDEDIAGRYATLRQEISSVNLVDITTEIIERAAQPFPTALKTLDSLHLATAMSWREREEPGLFFATHDHSLGLAARALGFPVLGL